MAKKDEQAQPQGSGSVTSKRPFGLRDKIGYMFGDVGNDFTFILQMAFFMVFYTRMGVNPGFIGTMLLVVRLFDAFWDVIFGRIVDVLKPTKHGRFRPWIGRIAIPICVASALMYIPFVSSFSTTGKLVYMVCTYLLWNFLYTMINIPYGSMASVITDNPKDRASLSVFRSLGAMIAALGIQTVLPIFVYTYDEATGQKVLNPHNMAIAAIICAICGIISYYITFFNVEERVEPQVDPNHEKAGFGAMLKTVATNRALLALICAAILVLLGSFVAGQVMPFIFQDYFGNGQLQSWGGLVQNIPVLLLAITGAWLTVHFGKKEAISVALLFSGVVGIVMYFLHLDNVVIFLVLYFFMALGLSTFNSLVWAIITDVIDYQEVRVGERDDATIYAIYSWARKLGQALAGFIGGWSLTAIGYNEHAVEQGVTQTQSVLDGLYLLFLIVPAVLYLLAGLVMAFWYPLTKQRVHENYLTLRGRREKATGRKADLDSKFVGDSEDAQVVDPAAGVKVPAGGSSATAEWVSPVMRDTALGRETSEERRMFEEDRRIYKEYRRDSKDE